MLTLDKLKPGDLVRLKSGATYYEVKVARIDNGLWAEHYRVTRYSSGEIDRWKRIIKGGLFTEPTNIRRINVQKNSNK